MCNVQVPLPFPKHRWHSGNDNHSDQLASWGITYRGKLGKIKNIRKYRWLTCHDRTGSLLRLWLIAWTTGNTFLLISVTFNRLYIQNLNQKWHWYSGKMTSIRQINICFWEWTSPGHNWSTVLVIFWPNGHLIPMLIGLPVYNLNNLRVHTFYTGIASFQIGLEVFGTGLGYWVQRSNNHVTALPARTPSIKIHEYISIATKRVSIVIWNDRENSFNCT